MAHKWVTGHIHGLQGTYIGYRAQTWVTKGQVENLRIFVPAVIVLLTMVRSGTWG